MFHLERLILEAVRTLQPLVQKIRRRRARLASQIEDASESMALNFYEGNYATKGNRTKAFSIARQEAGETLGGLRIAEAKGLLTRADIAEVSSYLNRSMAGLWKLIR